MKRLVFLFLTAILSAASARAALVVPEGGLAEGRIAAGPLVVYQPVSPDRWASLQSLEIAGPPAWPGLSDEQARLAEAPAAARLNERFWADAARFGALPAAQRTQLILALTSARVAAASDVARESARALASAQSLIEQGRLGEGDLDALARNLEGLSVYGEAARAAALEVRSALALSRARREAASFASKTAEAVPEGSPDQASRLSSPSIAERPSAAPAVDRAPVAGDKSWIGKAARIGALTYAADFATKAFAHAHLFSVFHEVSWREPLMAFIIPYMLFTVYIARTRIGRFQVDYDWSWRRVGSAGSGFMGRLGFTKESLPGLDEIKAAHPSLLKALSRYDIALGLMLGGLFGNGIDTFVRHGALDWIPLGRSMMNLADVAILLGLSYFQLAGKFFVSAARAARERKAMNLDLTNFLGLPAIGFLIAWVFGSAASDQVLSLHMKGIGYVYLMGFSMLIGAARYLAALLIRRDVKKFNDEAPRA